jgi:NADH:ubiquinone oxidoreductase subunit D
MELIDNLSKFIEQVDNAKKVNPLDLSKDQDLTIAIMNLISIEEHLAFSGAKTKDTSFYDMIEQMREYRKELMQKIIKTYRGEVWCISKHLLATSMRLMEVGTKLLHQNDREEAYGFFEKAYDMYCLFWGLNLTSVTEKEALEVVKKTTENVITQCNLEESEDVVADNKKKKSKISEEEGSPEVESVFSKLKKFVTKSVDCCRE